MEFQRKQFDTVLSRIEEPRGKIQVIIGTGGVSFEDFLKTDVVNWL